MKTIASYLQSLFNKARHPIKTFSHISRNNAYSFVSCNLVVESDVQFNCEVMIDESTHTIQVILLVIFSNILLVSK